MQITEIICQVLRIPKVEAKTASSQDSVVVRIRTNDGLEGVGEADASPEVVKAVAEFAATCRDETDLDKLIARLAEVIDETLQPEKVSVWIRPTAGDGRQTAVDAGERQT